MHRSTKKSSGEYEYRGYTIVKQSPPFFRGDVCRNPWAFQMPAQESRIGHTFSLKAAKEEIDFGITKMERNRRRSR